MYLIDTNIVIRALKGNEPEASFLKQYILKKKVSISVVVVAEFYADASSEDKEIFNELISKLPILIVDVNTAQIAGDYRQQFARKTNRSFLSDCFLASQAKLHKLTLVTNNKKDFPMKDIKIISP